MHLTTYTRPLCPDIFDDKFYFNKREKNLKKRNGIMLLSANWLFDREIALKKCLFAQFSAILFAAQVYLLSNFKRNWFFVAWDCTWRHQNTLNDSIAGNSPDKCASHFNKRMPFKMIIDIQRTSSKSIWTKTRRTDLKWTICWNQNFCSHLLGLALFPPKLILSSKTWRWRKMKQIAYAHTLSCNIHNKASNLTVWNSIIHNGLEFALFFILN